MAHRSACGAAEANASLKRRHELRSHSGASVRTQPLAASPSRSMVAFSAVKLSRANLA